MSLAIWPEQFFSQSTDGALVAQFWNEYFGETIKSFTIWLTIDYLNRTALSIDTGQTMPSLNKFGLNVVTAVIRDLSVR